MPIWDKAKHEIVRHTAKTSLKRFNLSISKSLVELNSRNCSRRFQSLTITMTYLNEATSLIFKLLAQRITLAQKL